MTVYSVFCFKLYFTRLFGVLFTFPSRYSSLSVIYSYLGSRMVPISYVLLTKGFLLFKKYTHLYGTITLFGHFFHNVLLFCIPLQGFSPFSLSFATTYEISFDFFSFCYWDVSLHRVFFFKVFLRRFIFHRVFLSIWLFAILRPLNKYLSIHKIPFSFLYTVPWWTKTPRGCAPWS